MCLTLTPFQENFYNVYRDRYGGRAGDFGCKPHLHDLLDMWVCPDSHNSTVEARDDQKQAPLEMAPKFQSLWLLSVALTPPGRHCDVRNLHMPSSDRAADCGSSWGNFVNSKVGLERRYNDTFCFLASYAPKQE